MYALPYAFANQGGDVSAAELDADFAFLFNPSVVNALKAGCKGDGTDDTAAINAIVATGARVIYFPWTAAGYGFGPTLVKTSAANCAFVGDPCRTMFVSLAGRGNISMIANPTGDPVDRAHRDSNLAFINLLIVGDKGSGNGQVAMGIELDAVNGALFINTVTKNIDADGVYLGAAQTHQTVGCSAIRGSIITEDCGRQGVTVICGDAMDLNVYGYRAKFAALDGEVNNSSNAITASRFFVYAEGCATGSSGVSVGFDGDGGSGGGTVDDIDCTVMIVGSLGDGFSFRRVTNFTLHGKIKSPVGNGVVGGVGNSGPSTITLDIEVASPGGSGVIARGTNDVISSTRLKVTGATQIGVALQRALGGTLAGLEVTGGAQQGVNLDRTVGTQLVAPLITGNSQFGMWITTSSSGILITGGKITGNHQGGYVEDSSCSNNRCLLCDISGTIGGADVQKSGTGGSLVELPPLIGAGTWAGATVTNGTTISLPAITVTGAAANVNNIPVVTLSVGQQGCTISSYVSGSNSITPRLTNATGSDVTFAAATSQAIVRRVY